MDADLRLAPTGPEILLVTFGLLPDGEPGGSALVGAFADRGWRARWVRWDDSSVDWQAASVVAVRSTWDYHRRLPSFLAWAASIGPTLLNGAETFAWNADKSYLIELARHVPVVPTTRLDDDTLVDGLREALARYGEVVIKPCTGAGGVGVCVARSTDDPNLEGLVAAPWIVQPLVSSVRDVGESSVYVFDECPLSQVDKRPAAGEIRVHEQFGGRSVAVPLDADRAAAALAAVRAAGVLVGRSPAYARVDLMFWEGRWCVSELELIEPGLYLDVDPANAERFADLVISCTR